MTERFTPEQQVQEVFDSMQKLQTQPLEEGSSVIEPAFKIARDILKLDPLSTFLITAVLVREISSKLLQGGIISQEAYDDQIVDLSEATNEVKAELVKTSRSAGGYTQAIERTGVDIAHKFMEGNKAPSLGYLQIQTGTISFMEANIPPQVLSQINARIRNNFGYRFNK